jgi:ankyrin repeat protein
MNENPLVGINQSKLASFIESVRSGDLGKTQQLLETDPTLLTQREKAGDGWAAIHHAAAIGQLDVATILIEAGCSPDLPSGEDDGEGNFEGGTRPLALAAWKGQLAMAKLLLNHGADPTGPDRFGHSAVHTAALYNRITILNVLLAQGADPNQISDRRHQDEQLGWYFYGTPLHVAAMNNSIEATRVLLAHGAGRDECWVDKRTPLFYAAASGSADVARVLLQAGAHPNAREDLSSYSTRLDYTPLHYAASNGHHEVIKVLLEYGADPSLRECQRNLTALELARNEGHESVVALLGHPPCTPSPISPKT